MRRKDQLKTAEPGQVEGISEGVAAGSDPEDLHNLVVEYSDSVYRVAYAVVRDASLAEDVTQETLVKAWLALSTFRGDASLKGWVMRIAYNTAISAVRSRRHLVLDPQVLQEKEQDSGYSTERKVQSQEVMDDFVEALDLLDDLSRSIVVLREIEGFSYEEIARALNVPMPTVKTRLLRARNRLGVALKGWK